MTTIEKIEKGIITLAEFTEDQQSFIRGIVKLSFNEGQEQALRIHDVIKSVCDQCRFESECRFKAENVEQNCKFFYRQANCFITFSNIIFKFN
jgi:hypothetical protein